MTQSPGRFENPRLFELITKFFDPDDAKSASLTPKTGSKDDLRKIFQLRFFGLKIQQWMCDDGKDNMVERAYIWNATAFQIDKDTRFVVDSNGERHIENLRIIPYVEEGKSENFDFTAGDGVGAIANIALDSAIDPSHIGRTANFQFSSLLPSPVNLSYDDFISGFKDVVWSNNLNALRLAAAFPSFVQELWDNNVSNTIDSERLPLA